MKTPFQDGEWIDLNDVGVSEEGIICGECGEDFETEQGVSIHESKVHKPPYTKEKQLSEEYWDKQNTLNEIADKFGVSRRTIERCVSKFSIRERDGTYPCPICNRNFETVRGLGIHRYEFHGKGKEKHRQEDWLRQKYEDEKLNTKDISDICGVEVGTIISNMERFDIKRRSQSEAKKLEWEEVQTSKSEILNAIEGLFKTRRYVDSEEEVPEGYEVQVGPQGGVYYETGTTEEDDEEVEEPDLPDEDDDEGGPPPEEEWQDIDPEELEEGQLVWVDDGRSPEPVLAEIEIEEDPMFTRPTAIPVREGDERSLRFGDMAPHQIVGLGDEEDVTDVLEERFEDITQGDLIIWEDEDGNQYEVEVEDVAPDRLKVQNPDGPGHVVVYEDEVLGTKDEVMGDEPAPDEVSFEDLQEGQEIVYEDYQGRTEVGTVTNTWEDDDRENITATNEAGNEMAVFPDDFIGLPGDSEDGIDVHSDDLTGREIVFDNGQRGYVLEGDSEKIHAELWYPDRGEWTDVYGLDRDRIQEVVNEDDGIADLDEGWSEPPEFDDPKSDTADEWIGEEAYVHQNLKVYDRATGEVREGFIDEKKFDQGRQVNGAWVQVKGGDKEDFRVADSNRFQVVGAENFDSLDEEDKHDAVVKAYQYNDFRRIDHHTRSKVQENFFGRDYTGEGSIMRANDWDTRKKIAEAMTYLKDEVDRASAGGDPEKGTYYINISEDESHDTIAHELGHAIATAFGYGYADMGATDEYGARMLSHNYTDYADTGNWSGYIDWDFSSDSDFNWPGHYMFTDFTDDNTDTDMGDPVGYNDFKEQVEQEVEKRFTTEEDEIRESWESTEYEEPDPDATAKQVFENLSNGDLVEFNVPNWEQGRDEDGNPQGTQKDYATFSHIEQEENFDREVAIFVRENGDTWRWPMDNAGNLNSDWSSISGIATDPNVHDTDTEDTTSGSGGIPEEPQSKSEYLATQYDGGFIENPETPQEKADNLMRAVNRAWYKQAKVHEATDDPVVRQSVVMESGYSATNCHETMAQLHEVMQTGTDSNRERANDIFEEHPYLALAYMDIWEPSPEIMEEMQELMQALGIEL